MPHGFLLPSVLAFPILDHLLSYCCCASHLADMVLPHATVCFRCGHGALPKSQCRRRQAKLLDHLAAFVLLQQLDLKAVSSTQS